MDDLEVQLKEAWARYIESVDRVGFRAAKKLRDNYFVLFHKYRENRKWRKLIHNNSDRSAQL